ncbi:ORF10R [Marbled eel polyomavirus]|uniref:ORF10R n=1 Tax=Marbled eel polyomavirus TaxID=1662286 RepID=UPI0007C1F551|nr:ORF10R [Marbled eel polyomavirus]ANC70199.1 ORF10R [Marbled eel polyomavirus]
MWHVCCSTMLRKRRRRNHKSKAVNVKAEPSTTSLRSGRVVRTAAKLRPQKPPPRRIVRNANTNNNTVTASSTARANPTQRTNVNLSVQAFPNPGQSAYNVNPPESAFKDCPPQTLPPASSFLSKAGRLLGSAAIPAALTAVGVPGVVSGVVGSALDSAFLSPAPPPMQNAPLPTENGWWGGVLPLALGTGLWKWWQRKRGSGGFMPAEHTHMVRRKGPRRRIVRRIYRGPRPSNPRAELDRPLPLHMGEHRIIRRVQSPYSLPGLSTMIPGQIINQRGNVVPPPGQQAELAPLPLAPPAPLPPPPNDFLVGLHDPPPAPMLPPPPPPPPLPPPSPPPLLNNDDQDILNIDQDVNVPPPPPPDFGQYDDYPLPPSPEPFDPLVDEGTPLPDPPDDYPDTISEVSLPTLRGDNDEELFFSPAISPYPPPSEHSGRPYSPNGTVTIEPVEYSPQSGPSYNLRERPQQASFLDGIVDMASRLIPGRRPAPEVRPPPPDNSRNALLQDIIRKAQRMREQRDNPVRIQYRRRPPPISSPPPTTSIYDSLNRLVEGRRSQLGLDQDDDPDVLMQEMSDW